MALDIFGIIYATGFLILFTILYSRLAKLERRDFTLFLTALFIGFLQAALIVLLRAIENQDQFIVDLGWFFQELLFASLMILIFVFVERIRLITIPNSKIALIAIFLGLLFGTNLIIISQGFIPDYLAVAGIGRNGITVVAFASITQNFLKLYRRYQDRPTQILGLASTIILASYSIRLLNSLLQYATTIRDTAFTLPENWFTIIEGMTDVINTVGLVAFVIAFLYNTELIYRSTINIQDLIVFSDVGVSVYGIGRNVEETSLDSQLLSGFITAMNNFVVEMKPDHPNETIQSFSSTHRSIDIRFGKSIGVAIVVEELTFMIRSKLRAFIRDVETTLGIEDGDVYQALDDSKMRELLKLHFPYLDVDAMQTY